MKAFEVLKKNRKYFAARTNGYPCKILIDEHSENLEPGVHELEVDDISVKSKYGTDLIFKLKASVETIKEAGICSLIHPRYNEKLVEECKRLGGKWDAEAKAWIFSGIVSEQVEALDDYYNSGYSEYKVTLAKEICGARGPVRIAGYKIASAYGRDSGARLDDGIILLSGGVVSGGSMKNWTTEIKKGSEIILKLSQAVASELSDDDRFRVEKL